MVTKGRIGAYAGMIFLLVLPLIFPRFYVYIASLILLYGLLATSLNFVLGFGGIYQFHHCVFYGVGAYGAALMLTKTGFSPWVGFIVGPTCRRPRKSHYGTHLHPALEALLRHAPDIPGLPRLGRHLPVVLLDRRR